MFDRIFDRLATTALVTLLTFVGGWSTTALGQEQAVDSARAVITESVDQLVALRDPSSSGYVTTYRNSFTQLAHAAQTLLQSDTGESEQRWLESQIDRLVAAAATPETCSADETRGRFNLARGLLELQIESFRAFDKPFTPGESLADYAGYLAALPTGLTYGWTALLQSGGFEDLLLTAPPASALRLLQWLAVDLGHARLEAVEAANQGSTAPLSAKSRAAVALLERIVATDGVAAQLAQGGQVAIVAYIVEMAAAFGPRNGAPEWLNTIFSQPQLYSLQTRKLAWWYLAYLAHDGDTAVKPRAGKAMLFLFWRNQLDPLISVDEHSTTLVSPAPMTQVRRAERALLGLEELLTYEWTALIEETDLIRYQRLCGKLRGLMDETGVSDGENRLINTLGNGLQQILYYHYQAISQAAQSGVTDARVFPLTMATIQLMRAIGTIAASPMFSYYFSTFVISARLSSGTSDGSVLYYFLMAIVTDPSALPSTRNRAEQLRTKLSESWAGFQKAPAPSTEFSNQAFMRALAAQMTNPNIGWDHNVVMHTSDITMNISQISSLLPPAKKAELAAAVNNYNATFRALPGEMVRMIHTPRPVRR